MNGFISLVRSLRPYKAEHWLILCVLLYSFMGVLRYYVPSVFFNVVVTVCGFGFVFLIIKNAKGVPLCGMSGLAYKFLLLWSMCLTFHMFFIADVRSTFAEYHGITTWLLAFFASPYFLPNMVPFLLLAIRGDCDFDFRYLWRVMWLMCILYLCYYPVSFWSMTHYSWSFDVPGALWGEKGTYGDFISNSTKGIASLAPAVIMIFFKKFIHSRYWMCFMVAYVGSILIQVSLARRGGLSMSLLYIAAVWGMYSLNDKSASKIKLVALALVSIGLCFLLFNSMADSFFSVLIERGTEDTRGGVEQGFYSDMKSDEDWMFGRGWFGRYYEPAIMDYRSDIETGYLALVLRGGLFYLVPYVAILILSFFNGYFRSRNLFCKSFAILCLMQVVNLYPYGWPAFNFYHFVVWVGVWVCNSKKFRRLDNIQIAEYCF